MNYIENNSHDIYFNLALEEYVFENLKNDEYFLLWKNDNCIVLGKYQNAFEEINIKEAEITGMKVARRNSGGGTVFHDKGNLNYSIMKNLDKDTFIDYDSFLVPVIDALNSLGIKAEKRRTCDIAINGKKISGSAQSSKGGRVLHHGTLLFNADLSLLEKMLKSTEGKIESRSVKSVRSIVTNIIDHIDTKVSLDKFIEAFLQALFPNGIQKTKLTNEQLEGVNKLAKEKYSDWQWNYGNSPDFTFEKQNDLLHGSLNVSLKVKQGIIFAITLEGENLPCSEIESAILGSRYSYKEFINKLKEIKSLENLDIEDLADCFF